MDVLDIGQSFVQNSKASEIFRDLVIFKKYFSGPILLFLDENILFSTYFLPVNSINGTPSTSNFGINAFKRGTEEHHFSTMNAANLEKIAKK